MREASMTLKPPLSGMAGFPAFWLRFWWDFPSAEQAPSCREYSRTPWQARVLWVLIQEPRWARCWPFILGLAAHSLFALPLAAILFSILTLVMVFAIATSRGQTSISTLLLAGIALNLVFGALTSFVITLSTREFDVGRVIVTWLMGDLNNRSWEHVSIVFPTTVIALAGTLFFVKDLNILMLGEETAANLGVNIKRARNALLLFSSIETGGAIAVSGVIGFVGLVAPHIMRSLIGPDNRKLIFFAGLLAAVFIIYADLFVRLIVKVDLKIGIVTSLLGGPFFLYLIVKHRKRFEYM